MLTRLERPPYFGIEFGLVFPFCRGKEEKEDERKNEKQERVEM